MAYGVSQYRVFRVFQFESQKKNETLFHDEKKNLLYRSDDRWLLLKITSFDSLCVEYEPFEGYHSLNGFSCNKLWLRD